MKEIMSPSGLVVAQILDETDLEVKGVNFHSQNQQELQCASMNYGEGHLIPRHFHPIQERQIRTTSEILILLRGRLEIDLYDENNGHIESTVVEGLSVCTLIAGGHGFKALTEISMIEIKQGPYLEKLDKVHF